MVLARYLDKTLFGDYNYITALVGSFELLADFGLNQIAIREIAKNRDGAKTYFGSVLLLKLMMTLLVLAVLIVVANTIPKLPHVQKGLYLYGISIIANYLVNTVFVLFRAFERMQYEALLILVERAIYVLLLLALVWKGASFVTLFWANIAAVIVKIAFATGIVVGRFPIPRIHLDWTLYRQYLWKTFPVGISQIINSVGVRIDIILLGIWEASETVAIFSGPYRIVDAAGLVSVALVTALFPVMARQAKVGNPALVNLVSRSIKGMVLIAAPLSIGLVLLAQPAIAFVLGSKYAESQPILMLLALIIIPVYLNRLFSFVLISIDRQGESAAISTISLLLNILVDLLLIPSIGLWGACLGAVSFELVRFLIGFWWVNRRLGSMQLKSLKFLIVPNLMMAMIIQLLRSWSWVMGLVMGTLAYGLLVYFGPSLDPDEKRMLSQLLDRAGIFFRRFRGLS